MNAIEFRKSLLGWYDRQQRDLPWRRTKDPYAIWLSEVMLQQTTVAAVIPYYERFLKRFPTLTSLAQAPIEDLLKEWAGLGYYNRIRNFHAAAHQILNEHAGEVPRRHEDLLKLRGFGPYTAAAVSSIAFNEPHACVDGNVMRVIARLDAYREDIKSSASVKFFKVRAQELLDIPRAGDFNQAMMELGATVCTPTQPQCLICPVSRFCQAFQRGIQDEIPLKSKQEYQKINWDCYLFKSEGGRMLLRQRVHQTVMRGLWELPYHVEGEDLRQSDSWLGLMPKETLKKIGTFPHAIMNQRIRVHLWEAKLPEDSAESADLKWVDVQSMENLPLTTVTKKALKLIS